MKYSIDENLTPLSEEELQKELQSVSDERKEKILKFRFDSGKMQSLRAYQLLQKLLLEEYSISTIPHLKESENGKPVIEGLEGIHFNLSHCKSGVACVVNDQPIGIDIESIPEKINEDLVRYVFSEREQEMILEAKGTDKQGIEQSPQTMFATLWTQKEAFVKMTGIGIKGNKQLIPLLEDWHNGTSDYDFITIHSPENKWICSICFTQS